MDWGFYYHLTSTNCQLCALARCVLNDLRAKSRKGKRNMTEETKNATHFVDDVMTTGTTLSACAKSLHDAGASRVWCLTLARAVKE